MYLPSTCIQPDDGRICLRILAGLLLLLISPVVSVNAQDNNMTELRSGLNKATSVYVTSQVIYIVEQGGNRLLKLDHSGNISDQTGGLGSGDYEFSRPVDVDATNGLKIFITDYNNRRVQVFDRRGQYLSSISGKRNFGQRTRFYPTQISVNDLGEVFFLDESERMIHHYDLDSNLLDQFPVPAEVEQWDDMEVLTSEILLLDKGSETLHRLALTGNYLGFYPADEVLSFYATDKEIWWAYSDHLKLETASGEELKFTYTQPLEVKDLFIQDGKAFILTSETLMELRIK